MNDYNPAEYRAGFTEAEYERYGDMVLINWRHWRGLRERVAEMHMEATVSHQHRSVAFRNGFREALRLVMQTMDDTQP